MRLMLASGTSPYTARLMTLDLRVCWRTTGFSASSGKVTMRSTSAFTSSSSSWTLKPSSTSMETTPNPSRAVESILRDAGEPAHRLLDVLDDAFFHLGRGGAGIGHLHHHHVHFQLWEYLDLDG